MNPLLETRGLTKEFRRSGGLPFRRRAPVRAVSSVALRVESGETLGLVGESGCGKSTLARMLVGLLEPTSGSVLLGGRELGRLRGAERRRVHRRVQLVFQDPRSSLNPRRTVGRILEAPLRALTEHGASERRRRIRRVLERLDLEPGHLERHPHAFSGGQAQRIALARALVVEPELLILDEPVSSLDVSVQAEIVALLLHLQEELGHAYLFISHDLPVVEMVAGRVDVMYLGRIVESGTREEVFGSPCHPYTRALLSSVPVPGERRRRIPLPGEPPSAAAPPPGCVFHPRCYRAEPVCKDDEPPLSTDLAPHPTACHFADDSDPSRHVDIWSEVG